MLLSRPVCQIIRNGRKSCLEVSVWNGHYALFENLFIYHKVTLFNVNKKLPSYYQTYLILDKSKVCGGMHTLLLQYESRKTLTHVSSNWHCLIWYSNYFVFVRQKRIFFHDKYILLKYFNTISWYVPYLHKQSSFHTGPGPCFRPQLYPLCCRWNTIHSGQPSYLVPHSLFQQKIKVKSTATLSKTTG